MGAGHLAPAVNELNSEAVLEERDATVLRINLIDDLVVHESGLCRHGSLARAPGFWRVGQARVHAVERDVRPTPLAVPTSNLTCGNKNRSPLCHNEPTSARWRPHRLFQLLNNEGYLYWRDCVGSLEKRDGSPSCSAGSGTSLSYCTNRRYQS